MSDKNKNYNTVQINFLIGLPASGKTTFSNKGFHEKDYTKVRRISYESLQLKGFKHFREETLKSNLPRHEGLEVIYLDGLFLDIEYIKEIIQRFKSLGYNSFGFTIFQPDVNVRLKNDLFRRRESIFNAKNERWEYKLLSSAHSILNMKLPISEIINLCRVDGYSFETKNTYCKSDAEVFIDWLLANGIYSKNVESYQNSSRPSIPKNLFCVASWCSGGTSGSCYDEEGDDMEILEDEGKQEIKDIDIVKLLLRYDIPIKELEKLIYKYDETFFVGDYYGGLQENSILVLDINKLLEVFAIYTKLDWKKIVYLDNTYKN